MKKLIKSVFSLGVVALLFGGWSLAAGAVHLVLSPGSLPVVGKITIVPKERMTFRETYVDTRPWTASDLAQHSGVATRLLEANKGDALKHVSVLPTSSAASFEGGLVTTTN